jgi:hypothetical protein
MWLCASMTRPLTRSGDAMPAPHHVYYVIRLDRIVDLAPRP